MIRTETQIPAWTALTYISFVTVVTIAVLGTCSLPLSIWERGYMGIAALFLVQSSIALTKTLLEAGAVEENGR